MRQGEYSGSFRDQATMPQFFTRKIEFFLALVVVALVVGWNFDRFDSTPPPYEEAVEQWAVLSRKATNALYLGRPEKALEYLNQAERLALDMPAGDQRLSETYDDMGHAYFRLEQPDLAREFQGKAVASRLLTGGPEAKDLNLFIERYQEVGGVLNPPYRFVAMYPPYVGGRWKKELAYLIHQYRVAGDTAAVEYLSKVIPEGR